MQIKNIKCLTGIGLISAILLQMIWLSNTYILVRDDVAEKGDEFLNMAVDEDVYNRLVTVKVAEGTMIKGDSIYNGETSFTTLGFQESLLSLGSKVSLLAIDSIYTRLLSNANIHSKIIINLVNDKDSILESSYVGQQPSKGIIKTRLIPIRMDKSENIQAIIVNPYWVTFQKMLLLIIATAVMMLFVGYCIAYQIRIIIRQRKIAEVKETFSYAMIHDMKTPIGTLQLGTHILRKLQPEEIEKRNKYLEVMEDAGEHLSSLANRVLSIAKLEQNSLLLSKEVVNLPLLVNDLMAKFKLKTIKQIDFSIDICEETVYADKEHLKEVIANLIDNAIKYSGESVHICITSREKKDYIRITVKDNGWGISTEDLQKIFGKFERARTVIKRQHKGGPAGFGLGLTYVKEVVEAHDGSVDVRSREGEYSEFIINLPKLTEEL